MYATIQESKSILSKTHKGFNDRFVVKDVSSNNSFGYKFGVFLAKWNDEYGYWDWDQSSPVATSFTQYEPDTKNKMGTLGAYREVFNTDEIEALVNV